MAKKSETQKGATIVEAAIIFPVLILTMVGLLELGLVFKDFLTVSFAAREGARVGALAGDDIDADCDIVLGVVADLGPEIVIEGTIVNIEIFKADQVTGNPMGPLNRYTFTGSDPLDCTNDWTPVLNTWPSTTRNVIVGPSSTLDIIGVTINATHDYITGMPPFRGSINLSETAIQRLEPEAFE
ncbi:MAG: TadE/TadG family type IV pilus assembly protein [Acidimicrobiia bacterium]